jgi:phage-related protein
MKQYRSAQFFSPAREYIGTVSETDQAIIAAHVERMRLGDFDSVHTKQLRGPIRELIVGHHRLTYFESDSGLYFVRGFRKKTTKAPKPEIDYAERVYKIMRGSK